MEVYCKVILHLPVFSTEALLELCYQLPQELNLL